MVFDLDHTLVDTNVRIVVLIREIGVELGIANLANIQYAQIEALRLGDATALGPLSPDQQQKIFGSRSVGEHKQSLFGARFYSDSFYLKNDTMIPGAADFVERLRRELGADVLYLSGRISELFDQATTEQLSQFNFPGFGTRKSPDVELILKPKNHPGDTDEWKRGVLHEIAKKRVIVAIFDDSKRNANLFAREFPGAKIVRVTRDVSNRTGLDDRVEQITNYLENLSRVNGRRTITSNQEQLDRIVKECSLLLGPNP